MDDNSNEISASGDVNTVPQRKPKENGYLTFLREYSLNKYGVDLVEMSIEGQEAWSKLSNEEKEKYPTASRHLKAVLSKLSTSLWGNTLQHKS